MHHCPPCCRNDFKSGQCSVECPWGPELESEWQKAHIAADGSESATMALTEWKDENFLLDDWGPG